MRMFIEQGFKGLYYFLKDKNYRSFIFLLLKHGHTKRFKPTRLKIGEYKFHVPDVKSFIWQYYEIFFKKSYLFSSVRSNPVIFDCGANVGTSCIFFNSTFKNATVHAFEPDPKIFNYLSENIKSNNASNIHLYNAAVWINDSTLDFGSNGADGGSISQKQSTKNIVVDAIRLKDKIARENLIDLLKIDIEGAEVDVILDCKDVLKKVNNIFIEYHSFHDKPQRIDEIIQVLKEEGFRYYLENESIRKIPFVNKRGKHAMDMQTNIFGYKSQNNLEEIK